MNLSLLPREIEFSSAPENINIIESFVEQLKTDLDLSEEMEANILVSLSEAVNNAIYHGNKSDPAKRVFIKMAAEDTTILFSVEDEGSGFNPSGVKDPTSPENLDKPTGRGIFLMKSLADKVEYFNDGRKVVIEFFLH